MSDTNGYCAECHKKDLELIKKDHELEKAGEKINGYQNTVKALEAQSTKPQELPSLGAVIAHCESGQCKQHADEWNAIKSKIAKAAQDAITPEEITARALKLGMRPKPEEIIVETR